jgi:hypothetical protein
MELIWPADQQRAPMPHPACMKGDYVAVWSQSRGMYVYRRADTNAGQCTDTSQLQHWLEQQTQAFHTALSISARTLRLIVDSRRGVATRQKRADKVHAAVLALAKEYDARNGRVSGRAAAIARKLGLSAARVRQILRKAGWRMNTLK